jgi:hypothetical protein
MDNLSTPNILSIGVLLAAIICFKQGMVPPNPVPQDAVPVDLRVGRLIPRQLSIQMALIIK